MGITDKNLLRLPAMTKDSEDIEPLKAAKRCQILKTIDVSEILTRNTKRRHVMDALVYA
ncbi:MAG TPA: hypothetical protein VFR94_02240 [Nitrososphaeraceae archaeon]|nr:hypothetical protein [Nitrososphaeraceae archaeon]